MNSQKPVGKNYKVNRSKSRNKSGSRRILIILFGSVIGAVILCLAVIGAIERMNRQEQNSNGTLLFYEADYTYDIMSDPGYLNLDRDIYFENSENGIKTAIIDGNMDDVPTDQHKYVSLLCDFISYAINGQTEELNALFSDEYIEADGKIKMDFTMQQLYNIKITYIKTLSQDVDGSTYVSCDYWLEYMIRKNNGTFRSDMESDCSRKEYVRVTDRDGRIGIDVLSPYTTQTQNQAVFDEETIIVMAIASIFLISIVGVSAFLIVHKSRKQNR